jgi:hypothetical protein
MTEQTVAPGESPAALHLEWSLVQGDGAPAGHVTVSGDGEVVVIEFALAGGQLPDGLRAEMLAEAFTLGCVRAARRVQVAVPLGDVDFLRGLAHHLNQPHVRAAGATCLIDSDGVRRADGVPVPAAP